jgi:hypothetical protein
LIWHRSNTHFLLVFIHGGAGEYGRVTVLAWEARHVAALRVSVPDGRIPTIALNVQGIDAPFDPEEALFAEDGAYEMAADPIRGLFVIVVLPLALSAITLR